MIKTIPLFPECVRNICKGKKRARACVGRGIGIRQVDPGSLAGVVCDLHEGRAFFRVFFDRASDANADFGPPVEWSCRRAVRVINHPRLARRARNKAEMPEAVRGLPSTPPTIVLPPWDECPSLPYLDLAPLGDRFTVKPAGGGGGLGVINGAASMDEILAAWRQYPSQRYLVQTHVSPVRLGNREAWFRVIHCAGKAYPCWWNVRTHAYEPVTDAEMERYGLEPLREAAASLAAVSGLDLFSTEIAPTPEGRFVVIDYINDPLDLRLRSCAPDDVVGDIAGTLLDGIVSPTRSRIPSRL